MSNQRLMKVKEKAGDGYAKTNAIGGGGGAVAMLSKEYQEVWGANLCGRVTGRSFLVMEPVIPVPDRGCHCRRMSPTPHSLVLNRSGFSGGRLG